MKKTLTCMIAIVLVLSGCSSNDGKAVQGKAGTSITSIKSLDQIADSNQKTDKEASGSVVEAEKKKEEENVSDENNAQNDSKGVAQPSINGESSSSSNASSSSSSIRNVIHQVITLPFMMYKLVLWIIHINISIQMKMVSL